MERGIVFRLLVMEGGKGAPRREDRRKGQPLNGVSAMFLVRHSSQHLVRKIFLPFPAEETEPQRCLISYLSQRLGITGTLVQVQTLIQMVWVGPEILCFQ